MPAPWLLLGLPRGPQSGQAAAEREPGSALGCSESVDALIICTDEVSLQT